MLTKIALFAAIAAATTTATMKNTGTDATCPATVAVNFDSNVKDSCCDCECDEYPAGWSCNGCCSHCTKLCSASATAHSSMTEGSGSGDLEGSGPTATPTPAPTAAPTASGDLEGSGSGDFEGSDDGVPTPAPTTPGCVTLGEEWDGEKCTFKVFCNLTTHFQIYDDKRHGTCLELRPKCRFVQAAGMSPDGLSWESAAPTRTSDRKCSPVKKCDYVTQIAIEQTETMDRICVDAKKCNGITEWTKVPKGNYTVTVCAPISPKCNVRDEYEAVAANVTQDRVCTKWKTCNSLYSDAPQYMMRDGIDTGIASQFRERWCEKVRTCSSDEYEVAKPTYKTNRQCQTITECDRQSQYVSRDATPFSDAVCTLFGALPEVTEVSLTLAIKTPFDLATITDSETKQKFADEMADSLITFLTEKSGLEKSDIKDIRVFNDGELFGKVGVTSVVVYGLPAPGPDFGESTSGPIVSPEVQCDATTEFACASGSMYGECIPANWQCDFMNDCNGGEDEVGCSTGGGPEQGTPAQCNATTEFACTSGSAYGDCITATWQCDNIHDCYGGEDEVGCSVGGGPGQDTEAGLSGGGSRRSRAVDKASGLTVEVALVDADSAMMEKLANAQDAVDKVIEQLPAGAEMFTLKTFAGGFSVSETGSVERCIANCLDGSASKESAGSIGSSGLSSKKWVVPVVVSVVVCLFLGVLAFVFFQSKNEKKKNKIGVLMQEMEERELVEEEQSTPASDDVVAVGPPPYSPGLPKSATPDKAEEDRGMCSVCGTLVLISQARDQNEDGTYRHQKCPEVPESVV